MSAYQSMICFLGALVVASLAACGGAARLPVSAGFGANPVLPQPESALIPVVNIAPARGWPADGKPIAAPGTGVARFAEDLDHPRWIYVLPNGDVLVAETNAPTRPEDGTRLYVTVGSNSNVAENGIDKEIGRAAIWEMVIKTGNKRIFASGLRNPNGMAWEHESGALWTSVNERDELGSDLVPDYMTSVRDGGFYGWPYSYYGQHADMRVKPSRLDLASAHGNRLPTQFQRGMFVGQHGSWNRKPHSGYKVIVVPFSNGMPTTQPVVDVLTGFLDEQDNALGRPVGVALDNTGALLVANDVGNIIWRISATR